MIVQTVLWRRLDQPGHESCYLAAEPNSWKLGGEAVFTAGNLPCRLSYEIECDQDWRSRKVSVNGALGNELVDVEVTVGPGGNWTLNGSNCPEVEGCIDIDLNFSPSTNLLPIRRLELAVGEKGNVSAAWLRFPSFRLEKLEQTYRRLSHDVYRYESAGGRFTADLNVNDEGFVKEYPNLWVLESTT